MLAGTASSARLCYTPNSNISLFLMNFNLVWMRWLCALSVDEAKPGSDTPYLALSDLGSCDIRFSLPHHASRRGEHPGLILGDFLTDCTVIQPGRVNVALHFIRR